MPSHCTGLNHWPCTFGVQGSGDAGISQVRQKERRQLADLCVCVCGVCVYVCALVGFPHKESACNAGVIPGSGRSPGGGHGNLLQFSCLENPTDREAWWAIVHGVVKRQTGLK